MKIIIPLLLCIMLIAVPGFASEVTLGWTAPTTNIDGTPLTDLVGFRFYTHKDGSYTKIGEDVMVGTLQASFTLPAGDYCFVGTAFDTSGNESGYSNEACKDMMAPTTYELRIITPNDSN